MISYVPLGVVMFSYLTSVTNCPLVSYLIFLGISTKHKDYCCYDFVVRRVRISHHVKFDEYLHYFPPKKLALSFLTTPDTRPSILGPPLPLIYFASSLLSHA